MCNDSDASQHTRLSRGDVSLGLSIARQLDAPTDPSQALALASVGELDETTKIRIDRSYRTGTGECCLLRVGPAR